MVLAQSLSTRLRDDIRFLRFSFTRISIRLPYGSPTLTGDIWAYRVLHQYREWVRSCLFADGSIVHVPPKFTGTTSHLTFWFKPDSISRLVRLNDVY